MKNRQNYVPAERQERILQYIETHGSGQISALSKWMDVSEATIRRDLDLLHQTGNVERTHGGAISTRSGSAYERQYDERLTLMEAEKKRIVSAALEQISPGDTIFLDSGTTCFYLGCALGKIPNLTVFTYDLMVAYYASLHTTSELIVTGGVRRHGFSNVLLGNQIIRLLQGLRIDKVFLGADAVDIDFPGRTDLPARGSHQVRKGRAGKSLQSRADRCLHYRQRDRFGLSGETSDPRLQGDQGVSGKRLSAGCC